MNKRLIWTLAHSAHWAVLYAAFCLGEEGAMYVLKFWVWVAAVLALALLADPKPAAKPKDERRPIAEALNMLQAIVTLTLFVWFGHIGSGIAWLFVIMVVVHKRQEAEKQRQDAGQAA